MQRLGYYIFGIALGLMILGWFQVQKLRAGQAGGAEVRAAEPASGAGGSSGP
jgi:hypothetical protein